MGLGPFIPYYGSKKAMARHYPKPEYGRLIEPFAGGAGYSLLYHRLQVRLYDLNPILCAVWDYLIRVSPEEIMRLPANARHVDDIKGPQEAKWLVGWWFNPATAHPRLTMSKRCRETDRKFSCWRCTVRERIARQVTEIRHWKVFNQSYESAPNDYACWFVDPPYSTDQGGHYPHSEVDYDKLARWCQSRIGQVIVCGVQGEEWLPFRPLGTFRASGNGGSFVTHEAVWTAKRVLESR